MLKHLGVKVQMKFKFNLIEYHISKKEKKMVPRSGTLNKLIKRGTVVIFKAKHTAAFEKIAPS